MNVNLRAIDYLQIEVRFNDGTSSILDDFMGVEVEMDKGILKYNANVRGWREFKSDNVESVTIRPMNGETRKPLYSLKEDEKIADNTTDEELLEAFRGMSLQAQMEIFDKFPSGEGISERKLDKFIAWEMRKRLCQGQYS